jgi:hypothetical protein
MNKRQHIKLSINATWYSFIIGTIIMGIFLYTNWIQLTNIGLFYILLAGLINGGIFISLFINFIKTKKDHTAFFLYSLLPFINLPIAFIYCAIALEQIFNS